MAFHRTLSPVKKVLLFAPDTLLARGLAARNAFLRVQGLTGGLRALGYEIILCEPAGDGCSLRDAGDGAQTTHVRPMESVDQVVRSVAPDALVICGWSRAAQALGPRAPSIPVVWDQSEPWPTGQDEGRRSENTPTAAEAIRALRLADYFTCAGELQRRHFCGYLPRAGWSPFACHARTAVVPPCFSPTPPASTPSDGITFVSEMSSAGAAPLRALAHSLASREKGELVLLGDGVPTGSFAEGGNSGLLAGFESAAQRVREVAHLTDQDRIAHCLRASVGVALAPPRCCAGSTIRRTR